MNKSLPKLPTTGVNDDEDQVIHDMDAEFEIQAANAVLVDEEDEVDENVDLD